MPGTNTWAPAILRGGPMSASHDATRKESRNSEMLAKRLNGAKYSTLAQEYGVSVNRARAIVDREAWAHGLTVPVRPNT